jgi:hypothetical protein
MPAEAERILYVDPSAQGQGSGQSWLDAFTFLQDALVVAGPGDQVWVAQGTYRPDEGGNITPGGRTASFVIPSGVAVYGGFPAGGGTWAQRDPDRYQTVLSGDLLENDRPGFWFHGENTFHVVTLTDVVADTVLNGCTITGGSANGSDGTDGRGGAILVQGGQPRIEHCTLRDNRAVQGGAVFNDNASPMLTRCLFEDNYGMAQAGGMYNVGNSSPVLVCCHFNGNSAFESGGALENASSPACPTLINCLFTGNRADWGGALAGRASSRPVLWNCTLYANRARCEGGALWNQRYVTAPLVINSILWENTDGSGHYFSGQISGGSPDIRFSCIQGWFENRVGIGNTGVNPYFADAQNGDFHLKSLAGRWDPVTQAWVHDHVSSGCIDAGDPNANWFDEHWPHGQRINLGVHGGTPFASLAVDYYEGSGDANHDFVLDMQDVRAMGTQWLYQSVAAEQDLDRDGVVNLRDFSLLAEQWGWFAEEPWSGHVDLSRVAYEQSVRAFDELRQAIDTQYSHYELRGLDWDALYDQYAPALRAAPEPDAFAEGAAELLSHACDPHIFLQMQDRTYSSFCREVTANCNLASLPRQIPKWLDHNERISVGRFADGIGYILIKSWSEENTTSLKAVYAALRDLRDAPGIILDVRANCGGYEPLAAEMAGCFLTEPKLYAKYQEIQSVAGGGLGPIRESWVQPNAQQPHYAGPVAVLMGPVCMNACESFLLMMRQDQACTLIGDVSYGSSGRPRHTVLSNGVKVYLPSWRLLLPDESELEGVGVAPDIEVPTTTAVLATQDPVLDRALTFLRGG